MFALPVVDGPVGEQTVPTSLFGCWRRNWIQFGAAGPERDVTVIWLQTASGMGDLRLAPGQPMIESDSSCGITVVEATEPFATADWLDGDTGFAQQSVSNFPEKGLLDWDGPNLMREMAPSGAYVEEWERLPDSSGPVTHLHATDAPTVTNLYVAGTHFFLAVKAADGDAVHEFSYGTLVATEEVPVVELSTVPARIGQPLAPSHDWSIVSHRGG